MYVIEAYNARHEEQRLVSYMLFNSAVDAKRSMDLLVLRLTNRHQNDPYWPEAVETNCNGVRRLDCGDATWKIRQVEGATGVVDLIVA